MKSILALMLCLFSLGASGAIPDGVDLAIELKGAVGDKLTVHPDDQPKLTIRFTNRTDQPKEVKVYLYDSYHKELPIPRQCAIRFVDTLGEVHPVAN